MSIPIQVLYLKELKKWAGKKTYFYTHIHNSIIHTGQQMEGIQVSMDRQFHKQIVEYTQLSETNQTKKRTNIPWFC